MRTQRRTYVAALAIAGLLAAAWISTAHRTQGASAGPPAITAQQLHEGLHFDAGVADSDRQAVLDAIASARPEARALVDDVDGLVDVSVGPTGEQAIGLTQQTAPARYHVTLDLAIVSERYGKRGIARLVLHELGHVVDFALVPDSLMEVLDSGIPAGLGCDQGVFGACADVQERFAETFAKWALDDIGVSLNIGYKVPPPRLPLEAWGAPLARLSKQVTPG